MFKLAKRSFNNCAEIATTISTTKTNNIQTNQPKCRLAIDMYQKSNNTVGIDMLTLYLTVVMLMFMDMTLTQDSLR